MICDRFKGRGSPALIKSYRDILLSDFDGKAVQRLMRSRLFPQAQSLCPLSMGGGLHGGETAIAHLYLRLFVDSAAFLKLSSVCIFFDVVNAFAISCGRSFLISTFVMRHGWPTSDMQVFLILTLG